MLGSFCIGSYILYGILTLCKLLSSSKILVLLATSKFLDSFGAVKNYLALENLWPKVGE